MTHNKRVFLLAEWVRADVDGEKYADTELTLTLCDHVVEIPGGFILKMQR